MNGYAAGLVLKKTLFGYGKNAGKDGRKNAQL
jgi:hypothetical protein